MEHNQFPVDFCPECGSLIDLDTLDSMVTCQACKHRFPFSEFDGKPIVTRIQFSKDKDWMKKYTGEQVIQKRAHSKMTIKEECPKCGHPEMKCFSMQTRSADEGSTVFYECENCSHKFSQNN